MLYACDRKWWQTYTAARHFRGLKITANAAACAKIPGLHAIQCRKGANDFVFGAKGVLGWSGNGGFQTVNLAPQFGVLGIALVGFDMSLDHGIHWHGRHKQGLNNPKPQTVEGWRLALDKQRPLLDRMGIDVVIASPNSRLTAYPKLPFLEAVARIGRFGDTNGSE